MDQNTAKKQARVNGYSYLRAVSCLAIVTLHTVFTSISLFSEDADRMQTLFSNVLINNLMWAVPCFLMVSGALLLDPARDLTMKKLFGRYILRVLGALLFFCVLFRALEVVVNRETVTVPLVLDGLYEIWSGNSWSHTWYLYLLIGIYLLLPFYRMISAHSSHAQFRYLLLVCFLFLSVLPILRVWNIETGFYIHISTVFPLYFFLGWGMKSGALRVGRKLGLLLLLLGTACIAVFTLLESGVPMFSPLSELRQLAVNDYFYGYTSVFVVLQAVGMFALFSPYRGAHGSGEKAPNAAGRILLSLDRCSFGVYLIHMIFVRAVLKHTAIRPYGPGSLLILPGLILAITAVSWLITALLRKIPGLRRIL